MDFVLAKYLLEKISLISGNDIEFLGKATRCANLTGAERLKIEAYSLGKIIEIR